MYVFYVHIGTAIYLITIQIYGAIITANPWMILQAVRIEKRLHNIYMYDTEFCAKHTITYLQISIKYTVDKYRLQYSICKERI